MPLLFPALPYRDITERHRRLAEIIEMIHTASLVHDDVLDDCSVRRGGCLQQCSCAQHLCWLCSSAGCAQHPTPDPAALLKLCLAACLKFG